MVESVVYPDCGAGSDAEGISVVRKDGRKDIIVSSDRMQESVCDGFACEAVLAVCSRGKEGDLQIFMHNGISAVSGDISIECEEPATAAVTVSDGEIRYMSDRPCTVKAGKRKYRLPASDFQKIISRLRD